MSKNKKTVSSMNIHLKDARTVDRRDKFLAFFSLPQILQIQEIGLGSGNKYSLLQAL